MATIASGDIPIQVLLFVRLLVALLLQAILSYDVCWDRDVSLHLLFCVLEKKLFTEPCLLALVGFFPLPGNTEMTDGVPVAKMDHEAALRLEAKGER